MSTATIKNLNKLVTTFLKENSDAPDLAEKWMESGNQKQIKNLLGKTKQKDPNAPKRGKSAYLFFCEDKRGEVKAALGDDAKATDVTKQLGDRWNKLKNNKKHKAQMERYAEQAAADKKRYETEKASYVPPEDLGKKAVKKGPKRARSAYLYFCEDKRAEVKKDLEAGGDEVVKATDVTKELGARWNVLRDEGSVEKYTKQAAKDKVRYQKEKDAAAAKTETPKKAAKTKKTPGAPKKAPKKAGGKKRNGYQVFYSENLTQFKSDNPDLSAGDVRKKLSAAWQKLTPQEKEEYKEVGASAPA